jgi:hypothetical protein
VQDEITLDEVLTEGWKLFFLLLKGILIGITRAACMVSMVLLYIAQQMFRASSRSRTYIDDWMPVRPAIFEFYSKPSEERQ